MADPIQQTTCSLLGPAGQTIQIFLGLLCIFSLVYKRYQEKPQRSWTIWGLDVTKQICSCSLAHVLNISLSIILSDKDSDECVLYMVQMFIDSTFGILLNYLILSLCNYYAEINGHEELKSGNYISKIQFSENDTELRPMDDDTIGAFYKIDMNMWAIQLLIWNMTIVLSKIIIFIVQRNYRSMLQNYATVMLKVFENFPLIKLIFVLFFVPGICNIACFWIQDNFIKKEEYDIKLQKLQKNYQQIGEDIQQNDQCI